MNKLFKFSIVITYVAKDIEDAQRKADLALNGLCFSAPSAAAYDCKVSELPAPSTEFVQRH